MLSFKELEISKHEDLATRIEKHSAQAGSVFEPKIQAVKQCEVAIDNVKFVMADVEMQTHILGSIPVEGDPDKKIKITGASMKAYVDQHPRVVEAREERAEAKAHLEHATAIVKLYIDIRDFLKQLQDLRKNEFYSSDVALKDGTTDLNDSGINK